MPCQLPEKMRRFGARFWSGKLALDRKNMLAQPRQQFAFTSGDGRILGQVCVTIDEPRKDGSRPIVDPADGLWPLMPPQVIVITGIGDAPILDNDRAVSPAAEL